MTWAALISLLVVCAVLLGALVLIAVVFSRSLRSVADHADRIHERSVKQQQDLFDRLAARDFGEYKVYSLGEQTQGSIEYPELPTRPWSVSPPGGDEEK